MACRLRSRYIARHTSKQLWPRRTACSARLAGSIASLTFVVKGVTAHCQRPRMGARMGTLTAPQESIARLQYRIRRTQSRLTRSVPSATPSSRPRSIRCLILCSWQMGARRGFAIGAILRPKKVLGRGCWCHERTSFWTLCASCRLSHFTFLSHFLRWACSSLWYTVYRTRHPSTMTTPENTHVGCGGVLCLLHQASNPRQQTRNFERRC